MYGQERLNDADISKTDGLYIIKADIKYNNDLINDIKTEEIPPDLPNNSWIKG